jgi:hypothetical protein
MQRFKWSLDFVRALSAGYEALRVSASGESAIEVGTTDGKADVVVRLATTLAASATVDVDLRALVGAAGETITLAEVHGIVGVIKTAGGTGTVTPHATNGWTGLGSAYSIPVSANGVFAIANGPGIAVSSTNKVFTYTNTGAASADIELYIVGRKA